MRAYIPDTPFATYVHTQVRRTRISTKLLTRKKTGLEKNGEQSVGRRGEGDAARERHHRGGGYEKKGVVRSEEKRSWNSRERKSDGGRRS